MNSLRNLACATVAEVFKDQRSKVAVTISYIHLYMHLFVTINGRQIEKKHTQGQLYTHIRHYMQCIDIGNKNFISVNEFLFPFFKLFAWQFEIEH